MGAHSRQKLACREWLDQIVIRAGVESFNGGFIAGTRGQHDHWNCARTLVGSQLTQESQAVQACIMTSVKTRSGGAARAAASAASPSPTAVTSLVLGQEVADVVTHIRVVIRPQDSRAEAAWSFHLPRGVGLAVLISAGRTTGANAEVGVEIQVSAS